jgi:ABC-2 type transport system permease protein
MSGFYAVLKKELQDDFASWRFIIFFALILLVGVYAIFTAAETIRSVVTGTSPFIFMALFTASGSGLPYSFLELIAMILPLVAIALGWDAINSERNGGTLSRLISQPIYRDSVINAKFTAGLITISVIMTSIVLLVCGLGIRMIGVVPTAEEAWRILFFLAMSIVYGAFWLGLSMLFSIFFRWVAASALASIAVWIVFFPELFKLMISFLADNLHPVTDTVASQIANIQFIVTAFHFSPVEIYKEAEAMILLPGSRTMSELLQIITGGTTTPMSTPLSLNQSLSTVWPNIIILFMLVVICFAISYIRFMRQEVRAT